jgi:hypothetical protein
MHNFWRALVLLHALNSQLERFAFLELCQVDSPTAALESAWFGGLEMYACMDLSFLRHPWPCSEGCGSPSAAWSEVRINGSLQSQHALFTPWNIAQ